MKNCFVKNKLVTFNSVYFFSIACLISLNFSCSKQEIVDTSSGINSKAMQLNYVAKIQSTLKDSLSANDFLAIDFSKVFRSNDLNSKNLFLRLSFKGEKISDDFVLLKTDSLGNILKAGIIHVRWNNKPKKNANVTVITSSLNRKEVKYLGNTFNKKYANTKTEQRKSIATGNISSLMAEEEPAGEQTLPDVVVTGYIYDNPFPTYWYFYDGMLGGSGGGSYTYTYGPADPQGGGGNGSYNTTSTLQLDYDHPENVDAIDLRKYLDCFGSMQESNAIYAITIATDIPVDGDPSQFFNWSDATPGHTYIELYKNGAEGIVEQNIGFYPNTSWKTVTGNSISSKLGDDGGHEYNARYTISLSSAQFQAALDAAKFYSSFEYSISAFNCTDFALDVFNAAGGNLSIPKYQISGYENGTIGSNTPQALYTKLDQMAAAGYNGIEMPGTKGYGTDSHGPCD